VARLSEPTHVGDAVSSESPSDNVRQFRTRTEDLVRQAEALVNELHSKSGQLREVIEHLAEESEEGK
jgi:hypothetical protein